MYIFNSSKYEINRMVLRDIMDLICGMKYVGITESSSSNLEHTTICDHNFLIVAEYSS